MVEQLKLFGLGFSWGGYDILAIPVDPQLKARTHKLSYPGPLLRLHIGLARVDDLTADLRQGLDTLSQDTAAPPRKLRAAGSSPKQAETKKIAGSTGERFPVFRCTTMHTHTRLPSRATCAAAARTDATPYEP